LKDLFLLAEDAERLTGALGRLCEEAKARAAFLVDPNGRLLADSGGGADLDTTALASLVAGSMAATGSLAQLLGERGFSGLFLEGARTHLYLAMVGEGAILVVVFDGSSSLGLVRFRVKRAIDEIGRILADFAVRGQSGKDPGPERAATELAEITDEEIDNLLSS
jgi:predicted regulator of Ras-like GTPase activity (Roadblock/LC7/MglB family)